MWLKIIFGSMIMKIMRLLEILFNIVVVLVLCVFGGSGTRLSYGHGNSSLRIYKGDKAKISDVPYIVMVADYDSKKSCTGAIVRPDWVLTAAHCVDELSKKTDIIVYAGFDDMEIFDNKRKEIAQRAAKLVARHPSYNDYAAANDYMCIQLHEPFELSSTIKVIPISTKTWPAAGKYKVSCIAAGWGESEQGVATKYLRKAYVVARHGPDGCTGGCYNEVQNKKLICLTRLGRICSGDSGGILACGGIAVGVTHAMYIPNDCGRKTPVADLKCKNTLSMFMYICDEISWISKYIPGVPSKCANGVGKISSFSIGIFLSAGAVLIINAAITYFCFVI